MNTVAKSLGIAIVVAGLFTLVAVASLDRETASSSSQQPSDGVELSVTLHDSSADDWVEALKKLLCALWCIWDGCTAEPNSQMSLMCCHPCPPEPPAAAFASGNVNTMLMKVVDYFEVNGIPKDLSEEQKSDALATLDEIEEMLMGELPESIDEAVLTSFVDALADMRAALE